MIVIIISNDNSTNYYFNFWLNMLINFYYNTLTINYTHVSLIFFII